MASNIEHRNLVGLIFFAILTVIILSLSMALRLFTRIRISKRTGWEDWTICGGFILYIVSLALSQKLWSLGVLKPVDQIPLDDKIELGKISFVIEAIYPLNMALIKISILLQMIRIFIPFHQTKSFYFIVTFAVLNSAWFFAISFETVFQCRPVSKVWDPRIAGHCLNYPVWIVVAGVVNTISDFIMLGMPMFWISRLQMGIKRKLTAGAVFVVGLLACVASIVRLVFSVQHLQGSTNSGVSTLGPVVTCTSGEMAAGIICANLPNIPAFIKYFKGKSRVIRSTEPSKQDCGGSKSHKGFSRPNTTGISFPENESKYDLKWSESRVPSTRYSDEQEDHRECGADEIALPNSIFSTGQTSPMRVP